MSTIWYLQFSSFVWDFCERVSANQHDCLMISNHIKNLKCASLLILTIWKEGGWVCIFLSLEIVHIWLTTIHNKCIRKAHSHLPLWLFAAL